MLPTVSWVHLEKEINSMPILWRIACSLQQSHSTRQSRWKKSVSWKSTQIPQQKQACKQHQGRQALTKATIHDNARQGKEWRPPVWSREFRLFNNVELFHYHVSIHCSDRLRWRKGCNMNSGWKCIGKSYVRRWWVWISAKAMQPWESWYESDVACSECSIARL